MLKRAVIIIFILGTIGGLLLNLPFLNQGSKEKEALIAFSNKEDDKVLKLLPSTCLFEHGLLLAIKGENEKALSQFNKALKVCEKPESRDAIEIAQALIDKTKVFSLTRIISPKSPYYPYALFLQAQEDYENGSYKEALPYLLPPQSEKTSWLDISLKRLFPTELLEIHQAHALIEMGNHFEAEAILNRHLSAKEDKDVSLSLLFLGLSHLLEADKITSGKEVSYNLSFSYLNKCTFKSRALKEKNLVLIHLKEVALKHIQEEEISFPLLHLIEKWEGLTELDEVARFLAKEPSKKMERLNFFKDLQKEFSSSILPKLIVEKMLKQAEESFKNDQISDLLCLWQHLQVFEAESEKFLPRVTLLVKDKIAETIFEDKADLKNTHAYLQFLNERGKLDIKYIDYLISKGKFLWKMEGEETKGTELLKIAISYADEKLQKSYLKEIERFFSHLYQDAEGSYQIFRLSKIHDAAIVFHFNFNPFFTKEKIANYLADAEYLFESHNYTSLKTQANWVLKLHPENQKALYLLGLAAYYTGNYSEACQALGKLQVLDPKASEILSLSQAHLTLNQEEHLVRVELKDDPLEVK